MIIDDYLRKPISAVQFVLQIVVLSAIAIGIGFAIGTVVYDEPFIDVMFSEEFRDTQFFEIFAFVFSVLYLALQIRRVNTLIQHFGISVALVLGIYVISIPYNFLYILDDPYFIFNGSKVVYWVWLIFARPSTTRIICRKILSLTKK